MGEEEIRCSYDDSSLEQYLLLILRYDYPKTSIVGACLLFSSNMPKASSHAARHVDVLLPQGTPVLLSRPKLLYIKTTELQDTPVSAHSRPDGPRVAGWIAARWSADFQGNLQTQRSEGRAEPELQPDTLRSRHMPLLCHLHHRRAHLH